MALQEKYAELISTAQRSGVQNLQVREQDNILYVDGTAPNGVVKNQVWDVYEKLDPDFRANDLVMNLAVANMQPGQQAKVTTARSNLNIRKGPGTGEPIVGKAAHGEIVTLVAKANEQWWQVKTKDGEEGYSYAQYLSPLT
ncbi:MAG: SH3 domain-containing protein [Chitinophagaceae bacterium]|nr:MAG: SH3 domain-containing protein [Chitinophagaceae bacterium]